MPRQVPTTEQLVRRALEAIESSQQHLQELRRLQCHTRDEYAVFKRIAQNDILKKELSAGLKNKAQG